MLGKLFKSKSLQNVGPNSPAADIVASQNGDLPKPLNSFEDSYTREILYGNSDFSLSPVAFNPHKFRLVVSQDGGNLRSKQVLYDSASEASPTLPSARDQASSGRTTPVGGCMPATAGSGANSTHPEPISGFAGASRLPPSHGTPAFPKPSHNINDLNDYMFGRGLPSSERNMATKIHLLPHFSAYRCVLISNLFSVSDCVACNSDPEAIDGDWNPQPELPTKESSYDTSCKSPGSLDLPNKSGFNSRFSIGVIIPLEDPSMSVEDIIAPFWTTISHHLIVLQKIVTRKLISALRAATVHNVCPYINNRRISLPKGFLQVEYELSSSLQKFIKLVSYNVNSPRILNINSVMAYALQTRALEYRSKLVNWALEVINWLEFKDGRNSSGLHFSGGSFYGIQPQASNSSAHSMHSAWQDKSHTSSSFLASLLALIIPLRDHLKEGPYAYAPTSSNPKHVARIVIMTSNSVVAKKLIFILSGIVPNVSFSSENVKPIMASKKSHSSYFEYSAATKTASDLHSTSSSSLGDKSGPKLAEPIPIKSRDLSKKESSDSVSLSISSKSGWEVPTKAMASISFSEQKNSADDVNVTAARQIPSSHRLNNSSSIAYLSSSLNSSLSSSASNYSLSKLGSSFMDKWRGSLVGSSKSAMPGYNFDSMDGAMAHDVLSEKPFFISAKSPSPAFDHDEPIWEDSTSTSQPASPGKRMSKYPALDEKLLIKTSGGETLPSVRIDRTKSSVYSPNRGEAGVKEHNAALISSKLNSIMSRKVNWVQNGQTLRININSDPNSQGDHPSHMQKPQRNVALNPNVAFVDAFRPEYIIQSCPANPRLENQVMGAMKNDLLFHHNNCGTAQVKSTTVFVSLRAREIKLIELSVGDQSDAGLSSPKEIFTTPVNVHVNKTSESPITSYFSGVEHGSHKDRKQPSPNAYRTTIKKVFTPSKNSGKKMAIGDMDAKLEKLTEIVTLINNNESSEGSRENLDRMFYNVLSEILD